MTYFSETRDTKNVVGVKVRFGVYRRESILAIAVFPSQNNNVNEYLVFCYRLSISSSALGRRDDPS
jgi:hypothetical protein